jgi:hypothetical protein
MFIGGNMDTFGHDVEPEDLTFFNNLYQSFSEDYELLIKKIVSTFSIYNLHDLYKKLEESGHYNSQVECYDELRKKILQLFLANVEDKSFVQSLVDYTESFVPGDEYLLDIIIKLLIHDDGLVPLIFQQCEEFQIPKDGRNKFVNACFMQRKLKNKQTQLLKDFNKIMHTKEPRIEIIDDNHYRVVTDSTNVGLTTTGTELIFRLYLVGEKDVYPSAYMAITNPDNDERSFDKFIVWFWDWAQMRKTSQRVPIELKLQCAEILEIVVKANNKTAYTTRDFNPRNPKYSWNNFQVAAGDARKRIKDINDI